MQARRMNARTSVSAHVELSTNQFEKLADTICNYSSLSNNISLQNDFAISTQRPRSLPPPAPTNSTNHTYYCNHLNNNE